MTAKVPDDRHGQGQAGDDRGREVAQEEKDDQDDQADGQKQGELHVADGFPDRLGAVVEDVQVDRGGDLGPEARAEGP